jgi:hypothetical protein
MTSSQGGRAGDCREAHNNHLAATQLNQTTGPRNRSKNGRKPLASIAERSRMTVEARGPVFGFVHDSFLS